MELWLLRPVRSDDEPQVLRMRELYRMRARQCRASAAATQDVAERFKLERIAWEWDQLAELQGDDAAESNVVPFEQFLEARERRMRRRARRMAALAGGSAAS